MAWLQLRVSSANPEFADEILLANGASAVSMVDAEDDPVLEPAPGETPLWRNTVTLGLFKEHTDLEPVIASLRELLPDGAEATFKTELIEDQDWVRVWLKDCPPLRFGEHFWVVPHEKLGEVTDPEATILKLDPGLAFGTGTHPTTALCLEWLSGQDLRGKTVLDFGCGSGILAIAALLLGAEKAICVDIDPQALLATRDNAQQNGVAERVRTLLPEQFQPFAADIVLANILANPLVQLAPLLASSIRSGGELALAGLLDRHAEEVRGAYESWFDFHDDVSKEGWTRITAQCRLPALINFRRYGELIATAGQPQPEHFPVLAQAGYAAVINLATEASSSWLRDEAQLCAQLGLPYHHLPVAWKQPTPADFETFSQLMTGLQGQKLFVHCALNMRVSVFMFLHRVLNLGESVEAASQDLRQQWTPDETWQAFIDGMLQRRLSS
ncbi:50S ribosomal protein L11 methyltransferase [Solimonas sp. K1W22B-7]|nr:50S ribosomal protein L11 methyltransferase [Solimonas sp. K1W22B-7]AXQ30749.1 50S ribosomal protein L11 methyltransferase [Solimonas sp. K1W22B-7]